MSERENASEGIRRFFLTWIVGIALVIAAVIFLLPPARDPLEVRKATLASIVAKARAGIRFNEHIEGDGPTVFARACKMGLEGIVSKRKESLYRSGPLAGLAQDEEPGGSGGEA